MHPFKPNDAVIWNRANGQQHEARVITITRTRIRILTTRGTAHSVTPDSLYYAEERQVERQCAKG